MQTTPTIRSLALLFFSRNFCGAVAHSDPLNVISAPCSSTRENRLLHDSRRANAHRGISTSSSAGLRINICPFLTEQFVIALFTRCASSVAEAIFQSIQDHLSRTIFKFLIRVGTLIYRKGMVAGIINTSRVTYLKAENFYNAAFCEFYNKLLIMKYIKQIAQQPPVISLSTSQLSGRSSKRSKKVSFPENPPAHHLVHHPLPEL